MKQKIIGILVVAFILILIGTTALAQERPFTTDDLEFLSPGQIRFQMGFKFLQNVRFPWSGLKGDLTKAGITSIEIGAGQRVQFELQWTAQNYLSIDKQYHPSLVGPLDLDGDSTNDYGDVIIGTKFLLFKEGLSHPGIGFKFSVKLPNAKNEKGLGTDSTDFYASLIFQKHILNIRFFSEIGLGILGDPRIGSNQSDKFVYGIGSVVPVTKKWDFILELKGRAADSSEVFPNLSSLSFGTRVTTGNFRWDISGMAGITNNDPDSGIIFGVSYLFSIPH